MITHIVNFKLKNNSAENMQAVRKRLLGMDGNIPQLRYLEVGIDELRTERSYDIVLITRFDSWADAEAYQVEPYHQEVLAFMREVIASAIAVDYESD